MVVAGHIDFSEIGSSFISYLYTFNVSIFFFVSGLLWKDQPFKKFPVFMKTKFKSILVPYAVFFVISLIYGRVIVKYVFHEYVIPFNSVDTIKALIFGSQWLNSVPTFNFALWFLPIFFISNCCFFFLQLIKSKKLFTLLFVCLIIISVPLQTFIPGRPIFSINVLPVSLVIMAAGYVWSRWLKSPKVPLAAIVIMLIFSLWVTAVYPGNISGIKTYWFFPSAIASILIYLRVAKDFRGSSLLRFLGAESLLIYGLHGLVANFYRFTPINSFFSTYWSGLMLWLLNLLFVIGITATMAYLYRRFSQAIRNSNKTITTNESVLF